MALTEKQKECFEKISSDLRQEFALEYVRGGYDNATQAYLKACKTIGRKPSKNPNTSASTLLSFANIKAFIASVKEEAAEKVGIDAAWVLLEAKKSYEINAKTFTADSGNDEMVNAPAAGKFLEMCGKHVDVQAFMSNAKVEHTLTDDFTALMSDAASGE